MMLRLQPISTGPVATTRTFLPRNVNPFFIPDEEFFVRFGSTLHSELTSGSDVFLKRI
jgi:hypothetical protein